MRYGDGSSYNEPRYLSLLGLLTGGILVVFYATPTPLLTSVRDVMLPLAILLALIAIPLWNWSYGHDTWNSNQLAQYGWMGVFVSGIIGIWWVTYTHAQGLPIIPICDEVLTVISLGTGAGVLVGGLATDKLANTPGQEPDQRHVLAESTWTQRSGPEPILVELVERIAELEGMDPCHLEPLSAYIDPAVFSQMQSGSELPWQVLFYTDKYEIHVNSHGTIAIYGTDRTETAPTVATKGESIQ